MTQISPDRAHTALMSQQEIDVFDFIFETSHTRPDQVNRDDLKKLYYETKYLLKEIDQIALHINNINYNSKSEIFLFDFDIIYSSINWLSRHFEFDKIKSRDTFWSSIAVELFRDTTFLLPGAAVELISFLRYNERKTPRGLTSHLATNFVDEFLMHLSPNQGASEQFYDAIKSLNSVNLMADTLFVAKEILESHLAHPYVKAKYQFPYEEYCYQDTFDYMMRKRKRQKPINTTIDAINYAIVSQLNIKDPSIGGFGTCHTIISNTRSLQEIPSYITANEQERYDILADENGVASPRQAVIYDLLRRVAKDPFHAEKIALEWAAYIREFRDHIGAALGGSPGSDQFFTRDLLNIDGITSLIWSFDEIQKKISQVRQSRKARLNAFKKSFQADEISYFVSYIVEYFEKTVSNTDIFKKVTAAYSKVSMDKRIENTFDVIDFDKKLLNEFGLRAGFSVIYGNKTYNIADDAQGIRLWSTLDGVDKGVFLNRVVELTKRLANLLLRDKQKILDIYQESALSGFNGGRWVIIKGGLVYEVSSRAVDPVTLPELNEKLSFDPVTADLIRYECQFYAIATNGRKFSFRSNELLSNELLREAETILGEDTVSFSIPEIKQKIEELLPV